MNGRLPASAAYVSEDGNPLLSWRVAFLLDFGRRDLEREIALDEPWDSEHNRSLVERMPEVYRSPGVDKAGYTSLMVLTGPTTPFGEKGKPGDGEVAYSTTLDAISRGDGVTNTILAVYGPPEKAVPWTKPQDLAFDREDPLACLGEIPETGLMVLMADGSVRTLPPDIGAETFRKLVEHQDGEPVQLP